jgi:hypothetical protein
MTLANLLCVCSPLDSSGQLWLVDAAGEIREITLLRYFAMTADELEGSYVEGTKGEAEARSTRIRGRMN